ncbi:MAG: ABC transporter permease [Spirochaetota bacterium]|nr:ABC transporter permease [Spirochaetota bacterium]
MIKHLLSRTAQSLLVLFILSVVMFLIINLLPDEELERHIQKNPGISEVEIQKYREKHEIKYFDLMTRFIKGDFGSSRRYQVKVSELLPARIKTTLKLSVPVFLITLIIAIPLGIFSAVYQYSRFDYGINLLIFIGISLPTFWIGLMAIYFFSLKLQIFPASGIQSIGVSSLLDEAKHFVLPILVLSSHGIGSWARYMRGSLLEILRLDYIRTARAKGLSEDKVVFKHALKNALIPLLTLVALSMPFLVSGALVTEQVFGIPGMGQLLLMSIKENDKELALATFLFLSLLTLLFNFLADLLYGAVDPRIKNS